MREIKAPIPVDAEIRIFLAGSIEQGTASNWQDAVVEKFADIPDLLILNPRRDNWDPTWEQSIANPAFTQQVVWELEAMNVADMIIMYFEPGTLSPITLLELGLYAPSEKLVVCCPEGFWRKGNVDIVCEQYNVLQINDFNELLQYIHEHFTENLALIP